MLELIEKFNKENVDRGAQPCEEGLGRVCDVCYEEYYGTDFFSLRCNHSFCVNCTADHLRINIESGNAMNLPCMQVKCKEKFTAEEIQQFCSAKVVKKFEVIREDVRVGKNKKLKWCARPNCGLTVRRNCCCCKRRVICECGLETCFKCGEAYHEGPCKVSGEAGFFVHNMSTQASRCPKCRTRLYKPDGCNHMKCTRCGSAFCWICRRDISKSHYQHFRGDRLFGCNGMTMAEQNVCGWVALLLL